MALPGIDLPQYVDATLLDPRATKNTIAGFCQLVQGYGCAGICVLPDRVAQAAKWLKNSPVRIVTVIGFPLGAESQEVKALAAQEAIKAGATELDMVWNLGRYLEGDFEAVITDIEAVIEAGNETALELEKAKPVVKVILECGTLSKEQMLGGAQLVTQTGAHYLKTGTGMSPASEPVTVEQVRLLRKALPHSVSVKAAGGIDNREKAEALLKAGADRLGISRIELVLGPLPVKKM